MTRALALLATVTFSLAGSAGAVPARGGHGVAAPPVRKMHDLSLEFVGQFQNSPPGVTPATHTHYGYLSYVQGLAAFTGAPQSETTALFTFFADAVTLRVISNGPLRVITRVGKLTIYRDASVDGDFAKPETFRDGTPVLVAGFRQQVVLNTVTNAFTTFHRNTIITTRPIPAGRRSVQLGARGETFTASFDGQGSMPGPPSGYLGGYANR